MKCEDVPQEKCWEVESEECKDVQRQECHPIKVPYTDYEDKEECKQILK